LASLPERRRTDLALKIAGYSYEEIRTITGERTFTNVNKSLEGASSDPEEPTQRQGPAVRRNGGQNPPSSLLVVDMAFRLN
jgi:hypothetical protein